MLATVLEDAVAPVGQVGTLVSALIDTGGTHDNSDVDGDRIAIGTLKPSADQFPLRFQ